jgi:PA domain
VAAFGKVPYGHTILGRVEVANPFDACEKVHMSGEEEKSDIPVILLAKRGTCPFATKAYNAGALGASALIIIDDKDEDPNAVIPYAEPEMGMKIHIPTILVNEAEFKNITTAVTSHKPETSSNVHEVLLSLTFPIIKKEQADVSFLFDISDKTFLNHFADIKVYLNPLIENGSVNLRNFYDI